MTASVLSCFLYEAFGDSLHGKPFQGSMVPGTQGFEDSNTSYQLCLASSRVQTGIVKTPGAAMFSSCSWSSNSSFASGDGAPFVLPCFSHVRTELVRGSQLSSDRPDRAGDRDLDSP